VLLISSNTGEKLVLRLKNLWNSILSLLKNIIPDSVIQIFKKEKNDKPGTIPKDAQRIASRLQKHQQRATYEAVAGILKIAAIGVSNQLDGKNHRNSWIVKKTL